MPSISGTVYVGARSSRSLKKSKGDILQKKEEIEKLNELERRASMVLFEAQSQRPLLSKYRDKVTICLNRITITRGGKYSGEEYPMPIESITSARVFRRFWYATLEIDTFGVVKPEPIHDMRVEDARLARRYILALIECKKASIDLSGLELEEIRDKLKNIGMVRYTSYEKKYHEL